MKEIIYFLLVSLCLLVSVKSDCYMLNPKEGDCKGRKTGDSYCCYVHFRTNRDPTFKTLCVDVIKDDIKKGHHEATIQLIEKGNYTGSKWNDTVMENFRDYSSINKFDCKSSYLTFSGLVLFFIGLVL